jgi:hypothetical protein
MYSSLLVAVWTATNDFVVACMRTAPGQATAKSWADVHRAANLQEWVAVQRAANLAQRSTPTRREHGGCWAAPLQLVQVTAQQQLTLLCRTPVQRLSTLRGSIVSSNSDSGRQVCHNTIMYTAAMHACRSCQRHKHTATALVLL